MTPLEILCFLERILSLKTPNLIKSKIFDQIATESFEMYVKTINSGLDYKIYSINGDIMLKILFNHLFLTLV